jgi:hypothetical protein
MPTQAAKQNEQKPTRQNDVMMTTGDNVSTMA